MITPIHPKKEGKKSIIAPSHRVKMHECVTIHLVHHNNCDFIQYNSSFTCKNLFQDVLLYCPFLCLAVCYSELGYITDDILSPDQQMPDGVVTQGCIAGPHVTYSNLTALLQSFTEPRRTDKEIGVATCHCIYWLSLFGKHIYPLSEKVNVLGCKTLMHIHSCARELRLAKQHAAIVDELLTSQRFPPTFSFLCLCLLHCIPGS